MKPYITRVLLLAAVLMLFYAACRKSAVKPAGNTKTNTNADTTDEAVAGQAVMLLYQSVTGQYGNANNGILSPFNTGAGHSPTLYSAAPTCGQAADTAYSRQWHSGGAVYEGSDTIFNYNRNTALVYTCDGGVVDGYQLFDLVINHQQSPYIINIDSVSQNYAIKYMDQTRKTISVNGTFYSALYLDLVIAEAAGSQFATYDLSQLVVNSASGKADVTSGTAIFHLAITPVVAFNPFAKPAPPNIYDGTIQFLGSYKAKLTINPDHVFMVNLTTGAVTPE